MAMVHIAAGYYTLLHLLFLSNLQLFPIPHMLPGWGGSASEQYKGMEDRSNSHHAFSYAKLTPKNDTPLCQGKYKPKRRGYMDDRVDVQHTYLTCQKLVRTECCPTYWVSEILYSKPDLEGAKADLHNAHKCMANAVKDWWHMKYPTD